MSIHSMHEKLIIDRQDTLIAAGVAMAIDKSDEELRDEYIKLAIMELETFSIVVGGMLRATQLLDGGAAGLFDELVDLHTTRGTGISEALFAQHMTQEQREMVGMYPKLPFALGIELQDSAKFGAEFTSFPLTMASIAPANTDNVFSIFTGKGLVV
jgi:hypothetical protein